MSLSVDCMIAVSIGQKLLCVLFLEQFYFANLCIMIPPR